jgi:hypothetical protein
VFAGKPRGDRVAGRSLRVCEESGRGSRFEPLPPTNQRGEREAEARTRGKGGDKPRAKAKGRGERTSEEPASQGRVREKGKVLGQPKSQMPNPKSGPQTLAEADRAPAFPVCGSTRCWPRSYVPDVASAASSSTISGGHPRPARHGWIGARYGGVAEITRVGNIQMAGHAVSRTWREPEAKPGTGLR